MTAMSVDSLAGYIIEELLAYLIRNTGYRLLTDASQDPREMRNQYNGLNVIGRGALHQVDVLGLGLVRELPKLPPEEPLERALYGPLEEIRSVLWPLNERIEGLPEFATDDPEEEVQQDRDAGSGEQVLAAAISPDGDRVVTASWSDGATIRVWSIETGELLLKQVADITAGTGYSQILNDRGVIEGLEWAQWSVSFSSDGTQVVTVAGDGAARIWDIGPYGSKLLAAAEAELAAGGLIPDPGDRMPPSRPTCRSCRDPDPDL